MPSMGKWLVSAGQVGPSANEVLGFLANVADLECRSVEPPRVAGTRGRIDRYVGRFVRGSDLEVVARSAAARWLVVDGTVEPLDSGERAMAGRQDDVVRRRGGKEIATATLDDGAHRPTVQVQAQEPDVAADQAWMHGVVGQPEDQSRVIETAVSIGPEHGELSGPALRSTR